MSKLDQAKQSLLKNIVELKALIAEQETIWAAIEATVEKLYSDKQSTTATNTNAPQFTDILSQYERA